MCNVYAIDTRSIVAESMQHLREIPQTLYNNVILFVKLGKLYANAMRIRCIIYTWCIRMCLHMLCKSYALNICNIFNMVAFVFVECIRYRCKSRDNPCNKSLHVCLQYLYKCYLTNCVNFMQIVNICHDFHRVVM